MAGLTPAALRQAAEDRGWVISGDGDDAILNPEPPAAAAAAKDLRMEQLTRLTQLVAQLE